MKRIRALKGLGVTQDFRGFVKTDRDDLIISFGLLCLNPSYIFKNLLEDEKPRSVILTSGTLNPSKILETELQTEFKV